MSRHVTPLLCLVGLALLADTAAAHISLLDPPPRHPMLKLGPCGAGANDLRGDIVTTFQGGQTITVKWLETVDHPGHYRISFDPDGQDDFGDPASFDELDSNPAVLVDGIPDMAGPQKMYQQDIVLPEISCDNCTLQVIQMMTDKPPYGDGNDLYYQCADLILEGGVGTGSTGGGSSGDMTTGSGTGGSTTTTGSPDTTGSPGTTGSDPTTGPAATTDAATTDATGTAGTTSQTTDATGTPIDDDKGGCACDGAGDSGGWSLLALLPLLAPRRRRA